VVNLVGLLSEWGKQNFTNLHAEGAGNVARAAKAAGVQNFVQISAIGASAEAESRYSQTKAAGEAAVKAEFPTATIIRPSVVFGPEDKFFNFFAGISRFTWFLPVFGCPLFPSFKFFEDDTMLQINFYGDGGTKFQPVFVGDPVQCKKLTDILLDEYSIYVQPINYPTVPRGTERIRLTPSPLHSSDDLRKLVEALDILWREMKIERAA